MCCVLSPQSCLTLCDLMDCSPPNSSVHGNSSGKITGMVCHAFLQRIFPTQGSNPGPLHWRQILYHLSYQGSLYIENVLVIGHIMAMTVKNNSRSFTLLPLNMFFFLLECCLLTQKQLFRCRTSKDYKFTNYVDFFFLILRNSMSINAEKT